MSNEIQKVPATGNSVKALLERPEVTDRFKKILGERASAFLTTVTQIAVSNNMLKDADPTTVYAAAMTAATLDLPINPNLGFAYIIPYVNRGKKEAQFQIGYKGLIQLAMRSGQILKLSVTEVREGQITAHDPLEGPTFNWETGHDAPVIGYAAMMRLVNGFTKTIYASKAEIEKHGKRFSKTFGSGPWASDFDAMAKKTILKRLISGFAPLSVQMQDALVRDQAVVREAPDGSFDVQYVDNDPNSPGDSTLSESTASDLEAELMKHTQE